MKKVWFLLIVWTTIGLVGCKESDDTNKGWISVKSTPEGASVYLDDTSTGKRTDCVLADVAVGEHIVRLTLEGYPAYQDTVEVTEGDTAKVNVSWSGDGGWAALWVRSEPKGAQIWLDGQNTGAKTDYFFSKLAEGTHTIRLTLAEYMDWDTAIVLARNDTALIRTVLLPSLGSIAVNSTPTGATVYLDDSLTGQKTNCILGKVPEGTHTIRLALENYLGWEAEVEVKAGQISTLNAVLEAIMLWRYNIGDFVRSSPAIASDGTIYVASYTNSIYALTPQGQLKWSYPTGSLIESSPAIGADGTIYFGSHDNYIYALNPSGSLKWRYGTSTNVTTSPAIASDGTIYIGASARIPVTQEMVDYLYALAPDSILRWRYEIGRESPTKVTASPAIGSDGRIYFGCENHYLYALDSEGNLKWRYQAGGALESSPAIGSDGIIYFGSHDWNLYALRADGSLLWSYKTQGALSASPVIGSDGTVYVGSNDGYFYALEPSGTLRWKFNAQMAVQSSAAVGSDGNVYFGTLNGYLYALDAGGNFLWRFHTEGNVFSSPAVASDGTIYVGSHDGCLYALKSTSHGLASSSWPKFHHDNQNTGRAH